MFAHGDDDLRDPVYDLTLPPGEHATNSGTGVAMEKIAIENEQTYHLDPQWTGNFTCCIPTFSILVFAVYVIMY